MATSNPGDPANRTSNDPPEGNLSVSPGRRYLQDDPGRQTPVNNSGVGSRDDPQDLGLPTPDQTTERGFDVANGSPGNVFGLRRSTNVTSAINWPGFTAARPFADVDGAQRAPNRSLGASDDPFDDSYGAVPGSTDAPGPPHQTDMMSSHTWRGQNQPPVGVRAQQLLNWIRDEDVDRRRDFPREWREASAWVDDQLKDGGIRDETRRLLVAARDALGTHDQFEGYHYRRFANLQVFDPETLPKYKPRLNYREQHPIQLGSWTPGDRMFNALAQPRRDQPRPWTPVNEMWKSTDEISSYDGEQPDPRLLLYLQKLADHETTLWARAPGNVRPAEGNNLAWRESNTHETCVNFDNAGLHGWVFTDPESGDKFVWDRTGLANDEEGFAVERGARRAGIQAALRQYSGGENRRIAAANGGLLVLPADEADVPDPEVVKRQAGIGNGRPLEIPALAANQMQATDGKMDPQGFISNMAQFWRKTRQNMNEARALYMAQNGPARGPTAGLTSYLSSKPLPPRSIFGPYVWTGVEPKRQFEQDTLRHMRGLRRLFERELLLAPRPFLADLDNYYQQGLQRRRPPGLLEQNRDRDLYPNTETPRILDQIELEWVRFLLNQSMTPGMAEDLEPRTTFFIHFAERLDRIFTDTSDTLFPTTDTSVTIEDLISHMANMKGPVEKIVFYPYDVKLWLERLDALGRCRYTDDWRAYGRVQRPILTHHPESLIIWENRTDVQVDFENHPEDMVYAPRFTDRRAWDDIVGGEPQVDESVRQYFRCLAYRWGRATDILNRQETGAWLTDAPLPFTSMQTTLDEFETHFRRIAGWDGRATATPRSSLSDSTDSPLVQVVQRTLNRPWPPQAAAAAAADASPTTTHQALETIRRGIIDELVRADGLLFPGRSEDHTDPTAPRGRESVWDWAGPAVRGDLKRFFGLDRWPLQLQSEEARRRIASDVDMDAQQVWDAYLEDPTPWTYYRPKARPYAEDRVKFRSGHRIFPIGDSARQKEVVKNQVIAMVGQAMGLEPGNHSATGDGNPRTKSGMFQKIKRLIGLKRKRTDDDDVDDGSDDVLPRHKLPRVDPELIPQSYDPIARKTAELKAREEATRPEVIDEDDWPTDAEDVNALRPRPADLADESLRIESNRPLG